MKPTRGDILTYARTFIGTPYHHQGRVPGVGLDCIGVLTCVCKRFGLTDHDMIGYSRSPDGMTLEREFAGNMVPIKLGEVQPGDVITFWVRRPQLIQHAGIATDVGILHTWAQSLGVVEHHLDTRWRKRIACCYQFPGIDLSAYHNPFKLGQVIDPTMSKLIQQSNGSSGCCGNG